MIAVGELALWVGLFLSVWGTAAALAGMRMRRAEIVASGARAITTTGLMLALAAIGLWAALLRHEFALAYVASHTTLNTPTLYLVTAFWGGAAGALLSWALALAGFAAIALSGSGGAAGDKAAPVVAVISGVLALTLVVLCFVINPYERVDWVPGEGRGLSAPLQHPLAAPHFVAIYAAYAAAVVALALAAGAWRLGGDGVWLAPLRRWSAAAWCLLTVAIALRMRWVYTEPALESSLAWASAEPANLILWLVGTGVVRSSAGRRGDRSPGSPADARRRVPGMYLVYVGAALLAVGLVGRRWWTDRVVRLEPGGAAELTDPFGRRWRFVSQGISRDEGINYVSTGVALEAWRGRRSAGIVSAERRQYLDSAERPTSEPAAEPGIRSFPELDVYVLLAEVRRDRAEVRIGFRPLGAWVWAAWIVITLGALATAFQPVAWPRAAGAGAARPA